MIKLYLPLILLLIFHSTSFSQRRQRKADKETTEWRYEIESAGEGTKGTFLVKVWTYSPNATTAMLQAGKNAVHGILFKGFGGEHPQLPMIDDKQTFEDNKSFFRKFFNEGGEFQKFIRIVNNQVSDFIKISKKEYKVGVIVSVSKDELRKYLEDQQIIKGLNHGF